MMHLLPGNKKDGWLDGWMTRWMDGTHEHRRLTAECLFCWLPIIVISSQGYLCLRGTFAVAKRHVEGMQSSSANLKK